MAWMSGMKERGSREGTKVFGLSIWQNGVATYRDRKDYERSGFRGRHQESVWGQVKFRVPMRHPVEARGKSSGTRSGRRQKQCRSWQIFRARRLDEVAVE